MFVGLTPMPVRQAPRSCRHALRGAVSLLIGLASLSYACDGPPKQGRRGETVPPRPERTAAAAAPALSFRGSTMAFAELKPGLLELAGSTAIADAILDRSLELELATRGIALAPEAIEAERELLRTSLDTDPNRATILLEEIRERQGLGPTRFPALLRRNAALRALAQRELDITEAALAAQHDVLHGPRRRARIATVPSLADADGFRRALEAGGRFAELAAARSSDPSAARGGLLEPISRLDPSYPEAFRSALFATPPGSVGTPVLADGSWILIECVEELPGDGVSLADDRPRIERFVRRAQERIVMERIARRLLAAADPVFFDSELEAAWKRVRTNR